jgi:AcrR family transcriptional regulator
MNKPERKKAAGNLRQQILEAALKVFSVRGFERSTTKAIATEAGIAEGTIFNYFPTKRDILFGFLEDVAVAPLSAVLGDTTASDAEIIKNFFRNRLKLWQENQAVMKVMIAESLFSKDLAEEFQKRVFEPGIKEIIGYIAGRTETGVFIQLDPSIVARSLVGVIVWFGLIQHAIASENTSMDDESIVDTLTLLFLNGIEASNSRD